MGVRFSCDVLVRWLTLAAWARVNGSGKLCAHKHTLGGGLTNKVQSKGLPALRAATTIKVNYDSEDPNVRLLFVYACAHGARVPHSRAESCQGR